MRATSRSSRARSLWIAPRVALALILAASLLARAAWLGEPCRDPCRSGPAHVLIFDEAFYVNAARVIDGIRPPLGNPYDRAPLGADPNAEHPQFVKLLMAGTIRLFGDGPWGWRLVSLLAATLAMLGMFALARAAGASEWVAVAAVAMMALDNLWLVGGRIGTLDGAALAGMLWGVALWLRGRPVPAGIVIGVGAACKEVALLALLVPIALEVLRRGRGVRMRALLACGASSIVVFLALLWVMGLIATPYDDSTAHSLGHDPFAHLWHILSYGAGQTSPTGPRGIASYPWEWLVDFRPIVYLNIDPAHPVPGLTGIHPPVHFLGVISPPLLLLGLPWMALGLRRRARADGVRSLALAWFGATWLPFALASLVAERTSYLYYMTIVMPALYLACGQAVVAWSGPRVRVRRRVFAAALIVSAVLLYPLTPLPS